MGGRQLISRDVFDHAVELLQTGLSVSQTAKRLELGECTVRRISHGKHALQQPPVPKKPIKWRNQYNRIADPTPEEIEARAWSIRMGWSANRERRAGGVAGTPAPFEFSTLPDSVFGIDVPEVRT